ncbi:HAD-IIB family hydrolase [Marinomonas sp.]
MTPLIIFTDLDGTLLDHHTYSFQPALPALQTLKTFSIPCVLNTSKTFAELLSLRQALNHNDPFIVENGSAVYIPKHLNLKLTEQLEDSGDFWVKAFGPKRSTLVQLSKQQKEIYHFTPFSDMSHQDLMEITGLEEDDAKLAMQREFTEPMLWQDSDSALDDLRERLQDAHIQIQRGGRFAHLMGEKCDKANAMLWLKELYLNQGNDSIATVALGDGENDIGMISKADFPVVIRSPAHEPPVIENRLDTYLTNEYGPAGWTEAIDSILIKQGIVT